MESSIAVFLMRQFASEQLPTYCATRRSENPPLLSRASAHLLRRKLPAWPGFLCAPALAKPCQRRCAIQAAQASALAIYHSVHFMSNQSFAFY